MVTIAWVTRPQCKRHEGRLRQTERNKGKKSGPGGPPRLLVVEYLSKETPLKTNMKDKSLVNNGGADWMSHDTTSELDRNSPRWKGIVHKLII